MLYFQNRPKNLLRFATILVAFVTLLQKVECDYAKGCLDSSDKTLAIFSFKEIEIIGEGGFGKVYKAQHLLDQRNYAIKKIQIVI